GKTHIFGFSGPETPLIAQKSVESTLHLAQLANSISETSSLVTLSSSRESRANLTSSTRAPKLRSATACSLASLRRSVRHADFAGAKCASNSLGRGFCARSPLKILSRPVPPAPGCGLRLRAHCRHRHPARCARSGSDLRPAAHAPNHHRRSLQIRYRQTG